VWYPTCAASRMASILDSVHLLAHIPPRASVGASRRDRRSYPAGAKRLIDHSCPLRPEVRTAIFVGIRPTVASESRRERTAAARRVIPTSARGQCRWLARLGSLAPNKVLSASSAAIGSGTTQTQVQQACAAHSQRFAPIGPRLVGKLAGASVIVRERTVGGEPAAALGLSLSCLADLADVSL
jgi:hypothetical protein